MPTYIHDGSNWQEVDGGVPTSTTTGDNIYVRTSGSGTMQSTRILEAYAHDGSWRKVYTAFVLQPPAKPATPTLSRTSGTWNDRIDRTSVSWGAVSGATGYQLDFMDGNLNVLNTFYFSSGVTTSGSIAIAPGGNIYNFRLYAYASNDAGTTYSNASSTIRVVSGRNFVPFSENRASNFTFASYPFTWEFASSSNITDCRVGNVYQVSKSGSSSDDLVPGYCFIQSVSFVLDDLNKVSIYGSSTRFLRFNGTGLVGEDFVSGWGNFTDPTTKTYFPGIAGSGTYSITAVGINWSSRKTGCVAGDASVAAINMTITGIQTTANTT